MSLHYLGKHEPRKLRLFSHAVCRVSKTTLRLLLQKFPEHAVDLVFFSDEKVFTVASPVNLQNDRVYAPSNVKLRDIDIAPERLLCCRPTSSLSLAVSVAVSKLGCTELCFVRRTGGESGRQILRSCIAEI